MNSSSQQAFSECPPQHSVPLCLFQSPNSVAHRVPSYLQVRITSNHDLAQFLDKDIFAVTAVARPGESLVIDFANCGALCMKAIGRLVAIAIDLKRQGGGVTVTGIEVDSIPSQLHQQLSKFLHVTNGQGDSSSAGVTQELTTP